MIFHHFRSGLLATIVVGAPLSVVAYPLEQPARTDPCPAQQQAMELLRSRIKSDQEAIRNLGIGITEHDLEDATDVAENGRKKAMLAAALSLLDGFLNSPEASVAKQSIAGSELRNGLGSIGTGQANALIGRIRAEGGTKQALIPLLRKLSQMSGKTSQLKSLDALSKVASMLKSVAEMGAAENTLEEAEAFFALATVMAGPVALADSLVNAVLNSAKNETQIYLMAKDIDALTSAAEEKLKALKVWTAKLESDMKTLQRMSAVGVCDSEISWQIVLQNQRMDVAALGNIDLYNQLLRLHAQIFKELGVRACESGFYPGGCNKAPSTQGQRAQETGRGCPAFSARNAQDALQVEKSSHKDVCWAYNGKTLIATSAETPDKANKPFPGGVQGAEASPTGGADSLPTNSRTSAKASPANSDGNVSKDGPRADLSPMKYRMHYVSGDTGLEILAPWSETGRGPGWSVGIMRTCSSSASEYHTNYNTIRRGFTVSPPQEKSVRGAEIAHISPGTYCVLINFNEHEDEHLNPTGYVSGNGFRPFEVEVKSGRTAEVSVPMGILKISLPSAADSIGCTFKDSEGYDLGIWEMTGGLEEAFKPGVYSYVCGGAENDFADQLRPGFPGAAHPRHAAERQTGSVQVSAGKTSKVALRPRPD